MNEEFGGNKPLSYNKYPDNSIVIILDCFGLEHEDNNLFKKRPRNDEDPAGLRDVFKLPESSSLRGSPGKLW